MYPIDALFTRSRPSTWRQHAVRSSIGTTAPYQKIGSLAAPRRVPKISLPLHAQDERPSTFSASTRLACVLRSTWRRPLHPAASIRLSSAAWPHQLTPRLLCAQPCCSISTGRPASPKTSSSSSPKRAVAAAPSWPPLARGPPRCAWSRAARAARGRRCTRACSNAHCGNEGCVAPVAPSTDGRRSRG